MFGFKKKVDFDLVDGKCHLIDNRTPSRVKAGVGAAAVGALALLGSPAHAALDVAVTDAITLAQTDMLTLYGALTVAGAVIWVGRLVYQKFWIR